MIAYLQDVWGGFLSILMSMQVTLRHLFSHAVKLQ